MTQSCAENHRPDLQAPIDHSQSLFSLKRAGSSPTAPFIQVDFCLPPSLRQDPFFTSISLVPRFNSDRKFYTPSFILGDQLNKYTANDEGYRMVHEKKINEMEEERCDIYVPKPSKANSYCCVCRQPFEDYLTHINVPRHRELMKKSPYYTMIQDLCNACNSTGHNAGAKKQQQEKRDMLAPKRKRIIKITSVEQSQKKPRGRPRKVVCGKMEMLVSIPTNVSISL